MQLKDSDYYEFVYRKYINSLVKEDIFPYPPETLSAAIECSRGMTESEKIKREGKDDLWAIGVLLMRLLGAS